MNWMLSLFSSQTNTKAWLFSVAFRPWATKVITADTNNRRKERLANISFTSIGRRCTIGWAIRSGCGSEAA